MATGGAGTDTPPTVTVAGPKAPVAGSPFSQRYDVRVGLRAVLTPKCSQPLFAYAAPDPRLQHWSPVTAPTPVALDGPSAITDVTCVTRLPEHARDVIQLEAFELNFEFLFFIVGLVLDIEVRQ